MSLVNQIKPEALEKLLDAFETQSFNPQGMMSAVAMLADGMDHWAVNTLGKRETNSAEKVIVWSAAAAFFAGYTRAMVAGVSGQAALCDLLANPQYYKGPDEVALRIPETIRGVPFDEFIQRIINPCRLGKKADPMYVCQLAAGHEGDCDKLNINREG